MCYFLLVIVVHFTPTGQVLGSEGPLLSSPDRQRASPYRDTYVTFSLRAPGRERRCGQTKVSRADNYQQTVTYDEVFALPVNYEALSVNVMCSCMLLVVICGGHLS